MMIRMATEKDVQKISKLVNNSIDHIKDKSYTNEQIKVWKQSNTAHATKISLREKVIFCAFENEELVGTIGLKENEVVGLYISPSKIGKGIGGLLLDHLEKYAKAMSINELKITSIPSAESYYQRKGYRVKKEVLTDLEGVKFPEKEMIKEL